MDQQIAHYENKLAFEIDSWDVHEAQKAGQNLVVLDVRSAEAFAKAHVQGAVSFPHRQMVAENVAGLDRDAQYVTYCDGIGCNASTGGALKMARLGFKVKELIGGLAWWREHGYPVASGTPETAAAAVACACD